MNEAAARQAVLLQAFETAPDAGPYWTAQDAAWASRAALESVPADASADHFVAERARHAMQRLAPREPAVAAGLRRRVWRASWWLGAALLGGLTGLLADSIGGGQRVNLLAPPLWGVVAWNLVVYVLLAWAALRGLARRRPAAPGVLARGLKALFDRSATWRGAAASPPLRAFAGAWVRWSAPLSAQRATGLLHTAAAALGAGLLAGLYARGLVLDYRAGWESTFLDAAQVHAALSWLLAPALAVSGSALPDAAALEALRFVPGQGAVAGASAAPWIHLIALSLLLAVVLPRTALALWSAWRARALARHFALPLDDAYFQRLLRHRQGGAVHVRVLPYAQSPSPQAVQGLRALVARGFGDAAQLQMAPVLAFGAEDEPAATRWLAAGTTHAVALFDLTATPEAENQGRFIERLARECAAASGTAPALTVLIDEAAFARRFSAAPERIAQRRAAWRALLQALSLQPPLFVDLDAPDLAAAEQALLGAGAAPRT